MKQRIKAGTVAVFTVIGLILFSFTVSAASKPPPERGSLTIHKYQAGGDSKPVPLNGVPFRLYQVLIPGMDAYEGLDPFEDGFTLDSDTAPKTLTSGGIVCQVSPASTASAVTSGWKAGKAAGLAVIRDLEQGYP